MDGTTEDLYFEWLYGLIGAVRNRNPARSYWDVSRALHQTEFTWFVANDDNRAADGIELRLEFVAARGVDPGSEWMNMGCSMLEMLIALSRRAGFETEKSPGEWFHELLGNIHCNVSDAKWSQTATNSINRKVETVVMRSYSASGLGGLFPLEEPHDDQRRVELWYQLSAYLLEKYF